MNLRQMEHFVAVARRSNMTAAAHDLGVAQPTLTRTIRALEQELGVPLFERLVRGVELTIYGRSLLRHAETVGVQLEDAAREISSLRGGTVGTVTIGAGPAWLRRILPLAVARIIADSPSMKVRIEGGFDDALLRGLRRGEIEFVVAELPSAETARDLKIEPLTSDELRVCCRQGHPLAGGGALDPSALQAFAWIMPPGPTRAQKRLSALFVALDLPPPNIVVETESMAFLLQLLHHSDLLTFTVSTTLQAADGKGLTLLDVPALSANRQAGIISRRAGWLSPASEAVIAELKRLCAADPHN
ncbi:MAG: LysR substrate-binding domain-containing protein [Hyphomicrobiales bacterium]